jgi:hypothetical protein
MLQAVPKLGNGKPRLLGSFRCPTYVIIQNATPNTLYLAETENALMQNADDGSIDALQITNTSGDGHGVVQLWWKGDMWAAGSAIPFRPLIIFCEGVFTGSALGGNEEAYGMHPTVSRRGHS